LFGFTPYDGPVLRVTALAARLLPVAGAVALLAACGTPPEPLPTGPPDVYGTGPAPSGAYPSGGVPTLPPTAGLPTAGYPTYATPTYPTYPAPTTSPPRPTGPPPAPRCTKGPTAAQVLAVVKAGGNFPAGSKPEVKQGPYCSGTWQFTVIGEVGKTLDQVDPLLAVTTGKPTALKVEEAGADVCSDHVESAAPPGIRVLACGS
jgi:hypothetical protein